MIVAVVCMGITLVVCETDVETQKETTLEAKESPAERDEIPTKNADVPTDEDADEDCSESCEKQYRASLDLCKSSLFKEYCTTRCKFIKYFCNGLCAIGL